MNIYKPLTVLCVGLVIAAMSINNLHYASADAHDETGLALKAITQAEKSGQDTSALVNRFVNALKLWDQAKNSDFQDCISYDDCVVKATNEFIYIQQDSERLTQESEARSSIMILENFAYCTIISFGLAFGGVYGYRSYRSIQLKRILNTKVTKIGDSN